MAALVAFSYPHISVRPEVMAGRPCIAGTRVRVMDLVSAWKAGVTEEELMTYFSSRVLKRSEIYGALTYYFDHQPEIDAAVAGDADLGLAEERRLFQVAG
jgi:uncharacterized protein (DUF433 family)